MMPIYEYISRMKKELWENRRQILNQKKSPKWTMEDLERATGMLKSNRSKDPNDMVNEIFKEGYAGIDFKEALLRMFNDIKESRNQKNFQTSCSI